MGQEILEVFTTNQKNDNITYLMSQIDIHQKDINENWNLFDIVDFLNKYHSSESYPSHIQDMINEIMDIYGKLIRKISDDYYQNRIKPEIEHGYPLNIQHLENIPNHVNMINNFQKLPGYQQQNIIYLAWFILYCQIHIHRQQDVEWTLYTNLITKIQVFENLFPTDI